MQEGDAKSITSLYVSWSSLSYISFDELYSVCEAGQSHPLTDLFFAGSLCDAIVSRRVIPFSRLERELSKKAEHIKTDYPFSAVVCEYFEQLCPIAEAS